MCPFKDYVHRVGKICRDASLPAYRKKKESPWKHLFSLKKKRTNRRRKMPSITYAVEVCTEARELNDLLTFLTENKDAGDDINVLIDTGKVTQEVRDVLARFDLPDVSTCEREHDGDFAAHRNYHATQCKGDYIFMLDADEIPQETLIRHIKQFDGDILFIPRINIVPGYTRAFLEKHKFNVNDAGFINWPDYQGRYYKNDPKITWSGKVHEKLTGSEANALEANPSTAIWHVKSVAKQNAQNELYESL
tara:strand:+ start:658 stop:1404 length:747 start_codon:yes stop_codon:yes gene_type:complete